MHPNVKHAFEMCGVCTFADRILSGFVFIGVGVMLATTGGCKYTEKTAVRDMTRATAKQPGAAAAFAARVWPVRVRDSITTKYLPGVPVKVPGPTQYVNCDSAVREAAKTGGKADAVAVETFLQKQVDTALTTWTQVAENTAAIAAAEAKAADAAEDCEAAKKRLRDEKSDADKKATRWEGGRNTWRTISIALMAYFVLRMALKKFLRISLP